MERTTHLVDKMILSDLNNILLLWNIRTINVKLSQYLTVNMATIVEGS